MKAIILVLSVLLSACSPGLQAAGQFVTTGVANPITKETLYTVENSAIVLFAGLNAYKQTCISGAIPPSCKNTIKAIQVYTRQVPPNLKTLRMFVKNNDQVNAQLLYNTIQQLITNAKTTASANGAQIGG